MRALSLIGVLEPRVGDGTYVTSLEPELLLTGMGFVSDLLDGADAARAPPGAADPRAGRDRDGRGRLDEDDFAALEACLGRMDAAETTQAFIEADEEFHRIIVAASGNATLASLIQNLSGGTLQRAALALGQGAGRDRDRRSGATGTSTTRCAPATPSGRAPPI